MDFDDVLAWEMAPERVDDRLDRLAQLEAEITEQDEEPAQEESRDICARFMEAIEPRAVLQQPLLTSSIASRQSHRESALQSRVSAPARKFTDLPLDILLEVAPHLYPLDVINLSRTSKSLRSILMSKSSRPIWKIALDNVAELPPCPDDLSEPLYAALVFDVYCFACGVNDAFAADYALRVRMCKRCYEENVVDAEKALEPLSSEYREVVSNVVLMLVPSANSFNFRNPAASKDRINPLTHLMQDTYFKPELEALLRFFWPLTEHGGITDLRPLVRTRVNYVMKRQAHAALIHAWDTVHCTVGDYAERFKLFSRFKRVFRDVDTVQLRGRKWDEATYPPDPAFFEYLGGKPPTSSPAEPAANLEIHHTSAADSDPEPTLPKPHDQLVTEMHLRKAREADAHSARIRARYAQLEEWYTLAVEGYGDGRPNFYEARTVWDSLVWGDDARGPLSNEIVMSEFELLGADQWLEDYSQMAVTSLGRTLEDAKARRAQVEAEAEAEAERENEARGHDQGGHGKRGRKGKRERKQPHPEDPETAVLRPTALFVCAKCGDFGHAWPGINAHWCQKHRDECVWGDWGEFRAEVWEAGVEVAERVLAVLVERGLGTRDRGRMQLDHLIKDGRVFCACGDPGMAALDDGLNWVALVKHVFAHLDENTRRTQSAPRLESEEDDAPVWIDDHELASCIRYLLRGVDTSEAVARVHANPDTRARINAYLSKCEEKSRPVCSLCEALTPDGMKDSTLFLQEDADAVVYHMQAKHGQEFQEKILVFRQESTYDNL